jgi:hypothetical protein
VPGAGFLLLLVVFDILPCELAFAPVDDFIFAPVVADEPVEVDVWCLVVCLYVLADATKGDPARPAITSAVIVRLLFVIVRNSSLHSPARQLIAGG